MQAVPQTLLLVRTAGAEQKVIIAGLEETLLLLLEPKPGLVCPCLCWSRSLDGLWGSVSLPPQQHRSHVTSAVILLTAIISELFCFNRVIIPYYLITVVLVLEKHLQWEIK